MTKIPRDDGCAMVWTFLVYRFFVSIVLIVLFYMEVESSFLGSYTYRLYSWTAWGYLFAVFMSLLIYLRHAESCENQAYLMVFLDIPAIVLFTHASGGIVTGLSLLLTVSIAFGGTIMRGRAVFVFSSIASLAVITAELYVDLRGSFPRTYYNHAGFMGLSFFAMAVFAEAMARRLRESEQLVSQREIDLADMAQLNKMIIQHIEIGVVVVDQYSRVRLLNEAAFRLLGMPEIQMGHSLSDLSLELSEVFVAWRRSKGKDTDPFSPKGAAHQLQGHFIRLGSKKFAGALIFINDVSELHEKAHQMKLASLGRLVASIAHEIRNPLGAISHAEQLLSESEHLDDADQRLASIIHTHSTRVNDIVENMLRLSRRETVEPELIDLGAFILQIIRDIKEQYGLADQAIKMHRDNPQIEVVADPGQFRQIFENLLGNSVTHFDRDIKELEITISAGVSERFGNPYLDVSDNGPGVDSKLVDKIFDPFFTTSPNGTGLGLFVTKELCEANRMRLEVQTVASGGSRFRVIFPKMDQSETLNGGF